MILVGLLACALEPSPDKLDDVSSLDDTAGCKDCGSETDTDADGDTDTDADGDTDTDTDTDTDPGEPSARRVVGYYTNWSVYARSFFVTDIRADLLTHLNYAFVDVGPDGTCALIDSYADTDLYYEGDCWDPGCERGNFHQLQLLKAAHPQLRTLLSAGGWTLSDNFSAVAADAGSRARFAASCMDLVEGHGFDGLDIDWEYPVEGGECADCGRPEDGDNFVLLLQAVRAEMATRTPPADPDWLLTAAVSANPDAPGNVPAVALTDELDWISVMSYDFHGGWETDTNHNAALYASTGDPTGLDDWNVSSALDGWLTAGVDPAKIVMGVPFYGRGWSGVPATDDGLFQPATGLPAGTWEAGVFDYEDLVENYIPVMTRHWSDEAQVPWLYQDGLFITYDDPESLRAKIGFMRDRGLGGAMFWDLSTDDADATLLGTVYDGVME